MNEKIFGPPNKDNNVWVYKGSPGGDVIAPFVCTYENQTKDDFVVINYSKGKCNFYAKIGPLTDIKTSSSSEGDVLGKAKNSEVRLTILKTPNTTSPEPPEDYFDKKNDCFKEEKTETEKNTTTNKSSSNRSTAIYDPYEVAAWPFYGIQGGMKALKGTFGLKTKKNESFERINEDIERIKQLMK